MTKSKWSTYGGVCVCEFFVSSSRCAHSVTEMTCCWIETINNRRLFSLIKEQIRAIEKNTGVRANFFSVMRSTNTTPRSTGRSPRSTGRSRSTYWAPVSASVARGSVGKCASVARGSRPYCFANLSCLTKAATRHQSTTRHLQAMVLWKLFPPERIYRSTNKRAGQRSCTMERWRKIGKYWKDSLIVSCVWVNRNFPLHHHGETALGDNALFSEHTVKKKLDLKFKVCGPEMDRRRILI